MTVCPSLVSGADMFNIEAFDIKLDTEFIGRNFIYSEEVDSTNSVLFDKENKFNQNGTVFLAEKQAKGRGRKDRVWYSAKDQNLTFSILLNNKKYLGDNYNLINFAASLSVALSIENLYQLRVNLKWPNDVLINGKKTAGILLESSSTGNKIDKIVIGIGINVNQTFFQGHFNIPPTSIKTELNQIVDRENLLAEILNGFEEILEKVKNESKWILDDWRAHCNLIGDRISVAEGGVIKYGIFEDIGDNGYLLLKTDNKIEKIHFGDISISQ
jgi:BirA family transcriptional regulator, biotin operon repressor / biotin---[acetyl-CoA-carboxylase] ligase